MEQVALLLCILFVGVIGAIVLAMDLAYRLRRKDDQIQALEKELRYLRNREALRAMRQKRYDAVLVDLCLPGMSGLDLLKNIRDQGLPVGSVAAMSGFDDDETRGQSLELGAEEFLGKPLDLKRLEDFLERRANGEPEH